MTEYTPDTDEVRDAWRQAWSWGFVSTASEDAVGPSFNSSDVYAQFDRWLNEIRAETWDRAWREIRMIPHWWNTDDQYGEFDLQSPGPDETSEQGAFMAVREIMRNNPYRPNEK